LSEYDSSKWLAYAEKYGETAQALRRDSGCIGIRIADRLKVASRIQVVSKVKAQWA
jgi:hypothetical protein